MTGTVRTADRRLWEEIPATFERLTHAVVAPTGARATVHYQRGLPPVVNDAA
nr:amidohydrolase [Gemmatimonadota bacterium]NIR37397.1 amidohydrolase [Actinomycetota bacterium]NIU75263.1 amidohydrolase [Gammaproteobacteria bacterium]NIQ55078.1 amidohydrolase [Gemmatimonadota bacterium]NIV87561.1 amidohydrolase [Actinomycetota bacterium]